MKVELIGKPQIIMSNQQSRFNYFAWPTIVKMKNNKIAVGASGFRMYHICPFGKAVISFSEDGGKTFTEYTGDFVELNFVLGDTTKKIYYKLKNKNDNTYTSVSSIEIPVLGYILNAIEVPEIKVVKTHQIIKICTV